LDRRPPADRIDAVRGGPWVRWNLAAKHRVQAELAWHSAGCFAEIFLNRQFQSR
jgi:hypothetical protein